MTTDDPNPRRPDLIMYFGAFITDYACDNEADLKTILDLCERQLGAIRKKQSHTIVIKSEGFGSIGRYPHNYKPIDYFSKTKEGIISIACPLAKCPGPAHRIKGYDPGGLPAFCCVSCGNTLRNPADLEKA